MTMTMEKPVRDDSKRTRPVQVKFNTTEEEKQLIEEVKEATGYTLTDLLLNGVILLKQSKLEQNNN